MNNKKFQTLSKKQLYLSSYAELNDPFEGRGFFTNLGIKHDSFFEFLLSNIRLTSLTGSGVNSMPMWAHYSNNHRGFCVAYDMTTKDNFMLCASTFPIEYREHRLDTTKVMQEQIEKMIHEKENTMMNGQKKIMIRDETLPLMSNLLVNIKHISWKYENEFRYTTCLPVDCDGRQPCYIPATPQEIYIGSNCLAHHADELLSIGKMQSIPVYRMANAKATSDFALPPVQVYIP